MRQAQGSKTTRTFLADHYFKTAKIQLVQQSIDTSGEEHIGGRITCIDTNAALKIIDKSFSKMKRKSSELDVDSFGGQDPMTKEEENAINEFIKTQKLFRVKKQIRGRKNAQRSKNA